MKSSFTFLRVRGIAIGAHWSWLIVAALIVQSLTTFYFPSAYPGLAGSTYLVMGALTALLFFASIVLHELGHALVALREGMRMEGITLWVFGGVARASGMFRSAGSEFRVAIAGPAVSVALAAGFWALAWSWQALGAPEAAGGVFWYLARINTILVAFNLVPALPLDGGRVLRSWLWQRGGSFAAATATAARAGKLFGVALAAVGALQLFTGGSGESFWLIFIGWFLVQAARSEESGAAVAGALTGRTVADLMAPAPVAVTADMTVAELVTAIVPARPHADYPVVKEGRFVGVVAVSAAGSVPPQDRPGRRVADIMTPSTLVPVLEPKAAMVDAFEALDPGSGRAFVVRDGVLVGIISAADIKRAVDTDRALGAQGVQGVNGVQGVKAPLASRRSGALVWLVVGAAMLVALGWLYRPPLAVLEPGPAYDVSEDISIEGIANEAPNGRYLMTSVRVSRPNALGAAVAALDPNKEVIAFDASGSGGLGGPGFIRDQEALFEESRLLAAAAGARAAGLDVSIGGSGAVVDGIVPGSPAARALQPDDVIVSVDGKRIDDVTDVRRAIAGSPAGTEHRITLERATKRAKVEVSSASLDGAPGPSIGVYVSTRDFDIDLPFEISFDERAVGGSSAGLAYALAIADMLDPQDYAQGRTVAATGAIDLEGRVGEVGGVSPKSVAAEAAGASLFLVPAPQAGETSGNLDVEGSTGLEDALRTLEGRV